MKYSKKLSSKWRNIIWGNYIIIKKCYKISFEQYCKIESML